MMHSILQRFIANFSKPFQKLEGRCIKSYSRLMHGLLLLP